MVLTVRMYPAFLHFTPMSIHTTGIPFWRHDAVLKTPKNLIFKKNFS